MTISIEHVTTCEVNSMPKKPWICQGFRVFQIVLRGGGRNPTPSGGGMGNLLGVDFLSGGGHLRRSAFDHSNPFQGKKTSVCKSIKI